MNYYIVLTIGLLVLGLLVFVIYRRTFDYASNLAISGEKTIKLPDLYDLVTIYLILCLTAYSVLGLFSTNANIKNEVGLCVVENVTVDGVSDEYDICINQYDNVIFKNQDSALEIIMTNNKETIKKIEEERLSITTGRIDNLYYSLQNRRENEEENELYILLAIYLNYYERETETYNRIEGK